VTRHNVAEALAADAEILKRSWRFRGLAGDWHVGSTAAPNVRRMHAGIAAPLMQFEAEGIENMLLRDSLFDTTLQDDELYDDERAERSLLERPGVREAATKLWGLGARNVCRLTEDGEGRVSVGASGGGGSTSSSLVVRLIEHHAALPDNVAKLRAARSRADECHLFVWVESSQHAATAAIGMSAVLPGTAGLPIDAPELPDCVDAAWVAAAYETARVWRFHRAEGWCDLGSHALHDDAGDALELECSQSIQRRDSTD